MIRHHAQEPPAGNDLATGALASVSEQALFADENAVVVESAPGLWEIVHFASAELVARGRYRCNRLLGGQLGTEDAIGNPAPSGAPVVVLDAALQPLSITETHIGLPWNWRVGPTSASTGDPVKTALIFTPEGAGRRERQTHEAPGRADARHGGVKDLLSNKW